MAAVQLYKIVLNNKVHKALKKLPRRVVEKFFALAEDLRKHGPAAKDWANYGKLGGNKYHCHLTHSWVAGWQYEKEIITIEVYYVGSRENAPY